MGKLLLISLLLYSCGQDIGVDVKDSNHTVTHKIDLSDITEMCENKVTNEEVETCIAEFSKLLGLKDETIEEIDV